MAFSFDTVVIFVISMAIIVGNILILLVLFCTEQLTHVNKYFLASLTTSDLCIGFFIAPFSIWTSMFDRWIYGEHFCHIEAHLAAIFWIASIYSQTWLSIDHYVAIRKPDRYESVMTRTRSACWVVFIWLAAVCFCCPPLFGVNEAWYYSAPFVCIINWNLQKAYFITAGLLIIVPPVIALMISNLYIFTWKYRQKRVIFEKSEELSSRPEVYFMNFVVCLVYFMAWFPWCMLELYETLQVSPPVVSHKVPPEMPTMAPQQVHFYLMWLAIGNSFWKFVLYVIMDHDFRIGLKIIYAKMACSRWSNAS
ncbi:hypothetical protein LSH36_471g05011 [Paralvinella palmiformis]|uniref:G-protein coupled receptors family 1 profile domain-containing protein n=1 Tax=Paralvinella palmiformis TaxID=53620 RepID=A0AAD9MXG3_9ANNE|nr:hypothetical protein LSH36_471g05011 [Paralvinella palmiformis]